jgi:hypothetical protein
MDAMCHETNDVSRTAKSCGPGAPMQVLSRDDAPHLADDGDNKARSHRGSRISRNTIAQGRPDVTARPVVLPRVFLLHADHGCQPAPGLTCALCFEEGRIDGKTRADRVARMRTHIPSLVIPAHAGIQYAAAFSAQAQPPLEYWIARSSRAEGAGHNAPSPDDASHRRENHEAMIMRKRNALIRSTTGGTRADEPDHHSSVNRFEFSVDWQQEAAAVISLPAIVLISLREFPDQAALSSGTPWPSRRCLAAAERRIRRRCAGAGDRLKRSQ